MRQEKINNLDLIAMHHMPDDMQPALAPIQTVGDGNCFPRTISYLLFKTQARYTEIRVILVYEAVRKMEHYISQSQLHIYWSP